MPDVHGLSFLGCRLTGPSAKDSFSWYWALEGEGETSWIFQMAPTTASSIRQRLLALGLPLNQNHQHGHRRNQQLPRRIARNKAVMALRDRRLDQAHWPKMNQT